MVIVMVIALALTSLPVVLRHGQRAIQIGCASHLRQIGQALQLYSLSHNELLPGPLFPVPQAGYDETTRQELAWYIAESLDCPKPAKCPAVLPALICAKYQRRIGSKLDPASLRSYMLNGNLRRHAAVRVPPFGSCIEPLSSPLKVSEVTAYGTSSSLSVMTDADKANVNPTLACWEDLPCQPAHGGTRNQLFFDGHVAAASR